jgi:CheY-like chemotaxis protein
MNEEHKFIHILLVEDNPDDIDITKRAIKEAKIINKFWIARDGQEALDFLQHNGAYSDPATSPKPGLILLDINLPKLNGVDVLRTIKQDPNLRRIPVVMLTVSKRDEDIINSYDNGCSSFIQKPVNFDNFIAVVKEISLYWGLLNISSPNGSGEKV